MIEKPSVKRPYIVRPVKTYEEMYLARLSSRDISALLGVAKSAVARDIKAVGLSRTQLDGVMLKVPPYTDTTHWRSLRNRARKIYERHHGVRLSPKEHVHHLDGDYTNNSVENLEVLTPTEHAHRHRPPNPVPRHLRPARRAYMKAYLKVYRRGEV